MLKFSRVAIFLGGSFPGGNYPGGNLPGGIIRVAIVRVAIVRVAIFLSPFLLCYCNVFAIKNRTGRKNKQQLLKKDRKEKQIKYH